ncbi:SemiSWEET family transporter [uncultured Campylobacter sp.]|uniref:SemiSWEET family transporter n=2 Tax=Campylobacter TaxID=194 RepID=UPI00262FB6A9|nr:SemiSWEET family transporter [uncultured Campylobacter sp.]
MSERNLQILGWAGTCLSVIMYVSYVPNIMANLSGNKVPFLQPLAAAINCTIWVSYGLLKPKKDYPLAAANFPGIIFGLLTAITAL